MISRETAIDFLYKLYTHMGRCPVFSPAEIKAVNHMDTSLDNYYIEVINYFHNNFNRHRLNPNLRSYDW